MPCQVDCPWTAVSVVLYMVRSRLSCELWTLVILLWMCMCASVSWNTCNWPQLLIYERRIDPHAQILHLIVASFSLLCSSIMYIWGGNISYAIGKDPLLSKLWSLSSLCSTVSAILQTLSCSLCLASLSSIYSYLDNLIKYTRIMSFNVSHIIYIYNRSLRPT